MSLYDTLCDYCSWNLPDKVKTFLSQNPGIDLTQYDGLCIQLAVKHKSTETLEALLKYFKDSLSQDQTSYEYSAQMHNMLTMFEEYIGFVDLSSEMKNIVCKYLPEIRIIDLKAAVAEGDVKSVAEYYQDCISSTQDVIEIATSHERDAAIETIASMQEDTKHKAMILCDAADIYSKSGKQEKAQRFYEKAINADPSHITAYLHFANMISTHLCISNTFDAGSATKAEDHYHKVLEYNPQYSCAHKKLGILYQKWSQNDSSNKQELEIKALESYIRAIECKNPKLQYDTLYTEITHLVLTNIHHPNVQEIISNSSTYNDARLQRELAALEVLRQNTDTSDAISHPSSGSEDGAVSSLLDEDIEYEEFYMDRDLDSANTSELSFIGHQADSFVDIA